MSFGKRPEEELFRIKRDPDCVHNLAADPMYAETKRKLRAEMEQKLREDGNPRVLGNAAVFDTYKRNMMRGQAYDNWLKNQKAY